jgi:response regulator NasT
MPTPAAARVLTVEDDPIVRVDLRVILEEAGYAVCAAARDGVEAVELARAHRPDLIVLDLGLPRLDGAAAARQILDERAVPIVALTGHRSGDLVERARDSGVVVQLTKPFHHRRLVETVAGALERDERMRYRRLSRVEHLVRSGRSEREIAQEVDALG